MFVQPIEATTPQPSVREKVLCRFCTAMCLCYLACLVAPVLLLAGILAMGFWVLVF